MDIGIDLYLHDYIEPSSKRQQIDGMKVRMATSRKETTVGVTY